MFLTVILVLASVVTAADGVPIHYEVKGKGEPALVFIPCGSCDRTVWENQVPVFAKKHRVVTIDLPGHGESGKGRTNWSIESYGEDVKRVVTKLGLKRVVLIGSSLGGPVVLEAARLMPERVVAIVPVDTLQNVEQKMTPEQVEGVVKQIQSDYKGQMTQYVNQYLFAAGTPAAVKERVLNQATAVPPELRPRSEGTTRPFAGAQLFVGRVDAASLGCGGTRCFGRMRIVAAIHPPEAIRKILDCLGLPSRAPPSASALADREIDEPNFS